MLTMIGPAETIAPLVALLSRPEQFRGRDVVLFIDNTQALYGLGKGDCQNSDCARMIHVFHVICEALEINVWFEWVASGANIADLPSRSDFRLLGELGATRFVPVWPQLSGSLVGLFHYYWGELAGRLSKREKSQLREVSEAVAELRGEARPSKRARF